MRTGENVSIYLDNRLSDALDRYADRVEASGMKRPSRSAIITLALRRYLERETNGR